MEVIEKLISENKYSLKCPYEMKPMYITIHNTGNNASAENEIAYMQRNSSSTSFHIAVDDKVAIIGIPLNKNAWHCGDGNGDGNRKSIGVEICYSTGSEEQFKKAELHAVEVVKWLMQKFNIPIENVRSHKSWSGKNCPHKTDMSWLTNLLTIQDDTYVKAVDKLFKNGIISDRKYWIELTQQNVKAENVKSLIRNIASKL